MPKGAQERTEAIKIRADSLPGSKKSCFFRAAGPRRPVEAIFSRFSSIFVFFLKCKISVSYCVCQQKQRFGPSRCKPSRSRVATSKNFENRWKIELKSSEIVPRALLGALLGRPLLLEAPEFPEYPESPDHPESPTRRNLGNLRNSRILPWIILDYFGDSAVRLRSLFP